MKVWANMKLTESIELWLARSSQGYVLCCSKERYKNAEGELWIGGMSQPPWLLAIQSNYAHINPATWLQHISSHLLARP